MKAKQITLMGGVIAIVGLAAATVFGVIDVDKLVTIGTAIAGLMYGIYQKFITNETEQELLHLYTNYRMARSEAADAHIKLKSLNAKNIQLEKDLVEAVTSRDIGAKMVKEEKPKTTSRTKRAGK